MGEGWCRGGSRAEETARKEKRVSEGEGERGGGGGREGKDEPVVEREEEEGSKVRDHRRRLDLEEGEVGLNWKLWG